ncbi:MAG: ABC transporter permease [Saprospiraceae bacterium]|nr:ABC transporter permease [Saprospiraceae bacterium]
MFKNYLNLTLRHLWRNRVFTALNIAGLAIGLSAAWIMYQYVSFEFSYDAQNPQRDQIYRVSSRFMFDGKESGNAGAPTPMAAVAPTIAGVEAAVPVFNIWVKSVELGLPGSNSKKIEDVENVVQTNAQYFQLAGYQWLAGSPSAALTRPDQVVLTRSRAAEYFPGFAPEQLIGQTITYDDTLAIQISGIVEDLGYPSSFIGQEFRALPKIETEKKFWSGVNSSNQLFLQLEKNADPDAVLAQFNRLSSENAGSDLAKWNMSRWHVMQSLSEIHFGTEYGSHIRTANKKVLFALMGVAGFLLLLACINYINLSTAQIPQRAREIGIRKTMGSSRSAILKHFLGETAVVAIVATTVAAGLTSAFFTGFGDLLPDDVLKFVNYGPTALFLVVLITVVSLLSGLYPGWLITKAQPVQVLRGQIDSGGGRRATLRKGLIVFQFAIAQLFIAGAIVVGQQLQFMLNNDLGFNRDAVVLLDIPWELMEKPAYKEKHFTLRETIEKLPGVAKVSLGQPLFDNSFSSNNHIYHNEKGEAIQRNVYRKYADPELIPLYELPLLAGRNLLPSDTVREYVLNENAVKAFGFPTPQAAIGQLLQEGEGPSYPIVGVVSDFHAASFSAPIEPLAFMTDRSQLSTLNIKLASNNPADWQVVFHDLEKEWKQFYPSEPFEYEFYDDKLKLAYEEEANMARIINLATGVALLISCLGLFGLAAFMAQRRTKEIGIRKVLGASMANLVGLLSKEFLLLVLLAFGIAIPVVYSLLEKWLALFVYRIEIQWWMFALTGSLAIAVAFLTVSFQSVKAALANPVKSLRSE